MTNNTKMLRDAFGDVIPQTLNENGTYTALANGDTSGIDFSKYKMLRDSLGEPIPAQYFDVQQMKFVPGVLGENQQLRDEIELLKRDIYKTETKQTDVIKPIDTQLMPGYYGNTHGMLDGLNASNWYHFRVDITNVRKFMLTNIVGGTVRLVLLRAVGSVISNRVLNVGEVFEIPDDVTFISINIQTVGASPPTTALTAFTDVSGFVINEVVTENIVTNVHISDRVNSLENVLNKNKILKILMVGNSFSVDTLYFLIDIAKSAEVDLVIGIAYDAHGSLSGFATKIQNDTPVDSYHKMNIDDYVILPGQTLRNIIVDEDWDIITYQQLSSDSGNYSSFQPSLNTIHDYVRAFTTNSNIKFGLNMTWAYAEGSTNLSNSEYQSQMDMYNSITRTYKQAMKDMDFDVLIPVGTSIQNARLIDDLKMIGNDLTKDGAHLSDGVGRYLAALTVFEALVAHKYKKDLFENVSFYPDIDSSNKFTSFLAKHVVKNALLNPFKITTL